MRETVLCALCVLCGYGAAPAVRVRAVVLLFIHLNHTNRLLRDEAAVRALGAKGFAVARDGQELEL